MSPVWKRDDAERIARFHVAASGFAVLDYVFTVRALAEVGRLPLVYGLENPEKRLASSWLVYVSEADPVTLKSSWLVIISRTDGAILYSGSAYDEG